MSRWHRFLCALRCHDPVGPVLRRSWEPGGWNVDVWCATCRRVVTIHYPDGSGG